MDNKRAAVMFKAFGDENRLQILQMLTEGERCACRLLEELNVTQPTLSHHMKILGEAGIVNSRKEGKWMHYSISEEGMTCARQYLEGFTVFTEISENQSCCR